MEILIISGLSGAGKSKTASFLEDMGFYIVDNMPAAMILKFSEFCAVGGSRYRRAALVYDVRTADTPSDFFAVLEKLKGMENLSCKLLFLEAEPEVIIHRYKESRRMHPLHADADSLDEAVRMERDLMRPVRDRADVIIDTSHISTARLRQELIHRFGESGEKGAMTVNIISFGFKYGLPLEADLVFDVRFMPNPFYIEELRNLTGLDRAVSDYVFSFSQTSEFLKHIQELLTFSLPLYAQEGKTGLVIAIGCTGGHHRSVAIAHEIANRMRAENYPVTEVHRDMGRGD